MNDRFKDINTINTILARAEHDIYAATGMVKRLIAVAPPTELEEVDPVAYLRVIADSLGQPYEDYHNKSRNDRYVHLRILGALFIKTYLPSIGQKDVAALLNVDRTSVTYYLKLAQELIQTEEADFKPKYDNALNALTQWLAAN